MLFPRRLQNATLLDFICVVFLCSEQVHVQQSSINGLKVSYRSVLCLCFGYLHLLSADVEIEEQNQRSPCLPNELLLSLFHSSLEQDLSDRQIPLVSSDHIEFMHHILERERDGHVAPFCLPTIKGESLT